MAVHYRENQKLSAIIDDIDTMDSEIAKKLTKVLCKDFNYHYGSYSSSGPDKNGEVKEEWTCWNCKRKVKSTTIVEKVDDKEENG